MVNLQKAMQRRQLAQVAKAAGKRKIGKPPRMLYPNTAEIRYREYLLSIVSQIQKIVETTVIPQLPAIARAAGNERFDSWVDDISGLLSQVKINYEKDKPDYTEYVKGVAANTNSWNNAQFQKLIKQTVGVDLFHSVPSLNNKLSLFANQNVELIKGLSDDMLKNISVATQNALKQGLRHEEIAKKLRDTYGISKNKAKFIARDQVSKLNGDLTQARQQSAGIQLYYWRTMHDERTRKTHSVLDGKLCRWDDYTVYSDDGGKTWKKRSDIGGYSEGHPGDDFQCRCYGEPYLADVDAILQGERQPTPEPVPEPEPIKLSKPVTPAPAVPIKKEREPVSVVAGFRDIIDRTTKTEVGRNVAFMREERVEHLVSGNNAKKVARHTDNKIDECSLNWNDVKSNGFIIHNHPGDSCFSSADLKVFNVTAPKKFIVVSKKYTYVLEPYSNVNKAVRKSIDETFSKLNSLGYTEADEIFTNKKRYFPEKFQPSIISDEDRAKWKGLSDTEIKKEKVKIYIEIDNLRNKIFDFRIPARSNSPSFNHYTLQYKNLSTDAERIDFLKRNSYNMQLDFSMYDKAGVRIDSEDAVNPLEQSKKDNSELIIENGIAILKDNDIH